MAKINGIELKNVKTFPDHEGCMIACGDVWFNGKKLGHWSQDSWGGPDNYDFNVAVLNDAVEAYKRSELVEEQDREIVDLDILLSELCYLKDKEKIAKRYYKKGYRTVVFFTDGYHMTYFWTPKNKEEALNCDFFKKTMAECQEDFYKDATIKVAAYEAADFDFTV